MRGRARPRIFVFAPHNLSVILSLSLRTFAGAMHLDDANPFNISAAETTGELLKHCSLSLSCRDDTHDTKNTEPKFIFIHLIPLQSESKEHVACVIAVFASVASSQARKLMFRGTKKRVRQSPIYLINLQVHAYTLLAATGALAPFNGISKFLRIFSGDPFLRERQPYLRQTSE